MSTLRAELSALDRAEAGLQRDDHPFSTGASRDVLRALQASGLEVCTAKGGGFWIKGEGRVSLAQARKRVGLAAPTRIARPRVAAWGDYATVAALSRARGTR